mmetsp:Transcript_15138/g.35003  ORF Transcript_15138/g.35003 Transcript_15138/m.35003 type:complete len:123 (-) Transcript_15138:323-691(-)
MIEGRAGSARLDFDRGWTFPKVTASFCMHKRTAEAKSCCFVEVFQQGTAGVLDAPEEVQPEIPSARLLLDCPFSDASFAGASCASLEIQEISSAGTGTICSGMVGGEPPREVSNEIIWSFVK